MVSLSVLVKAVVLKLFLVFGTLSLIFAETPWRKAVAKITDLEDFKPRNSSASWVQANFVPIKPKLAQIFMMSPCCT